MRILKYTAAPFKGGCPSFRNNEPATVGKEDEKPSPMATPVVGAQKIKNLKSTPQFNYSNRCNAAHLTVSADPAS